MAAQNLQNCGNTTPAMIHPRLIDWKATARRNRLLVRVLEPEQEQTRVVLLDRVD